MAGNIDGVSDSDHLALARLSARYAKSVDERDVATFVESFMPTGVLAIYHSDDHAHPISELHGHDELPIVVTERMAAYSATFHFLGQSVYCSDGPGTSGTVYCVANHLQVTPRGAINFQTYIRYEDKYQRGSNGQWKFAERSAYVLWTQTCPADSPKRLSKT